MFYKVVTVCMMLGVAMAASAQEDAPSPDSTGTQPPAVDEIFIIRSRGGDYTVITENAQQLVEIPGALGDPLLAVFSLPGVLFGADEGGTPAVRGSSPADNLYLVDGIPAGYIFHAFSTSIFSEHIIQDFELYSAGFGAQYGDATGAVFDIRLRQPRNQPITTSVDVSMLRSGIFIEGAVTENSEFYLSARNSMMQYFIGYFEDEIEEEEGIRIQSAPRDRDYQFKYAWRIDDANTLTLNANGARDIAQAEFTERSDPVRANPDMEGDARIDRGFDSQSLQWLRQTDTGTTLNISLGRFTDKINTFWGDNYYANIRFDDTLLKAVYVTPLTQSHTLSMGTELHKYRFSYDTRQVHFVCTEFDPDCELRRGEIITHAEDLDVAARQLFINDYWTLTENLSLDAGLHFQQNDYTNERFVHPRVALAWQFAPRWTATWTS
jgi:outer membrane receptor for ferrienterochelin and colicin